MPSFHPFLRLPLGLRNEIYFFTLIPDNNLSLLWTSRHIRWEAQRYLHSNVTYRMTMRYSYSPQGERRVEGVDLHISLIRPAPLSVSRVEAIFISNGTSRFTNCMVNVDFGTRRAPRLVGPLSVDLLDLRQIRYFWHLVRHVRDLDLGRGFGTA